jgi:hypothetical protein
VLSRFSPSAGRLARSVWFVGLAGCVGALAWTGDARTIPLAMGFPLVWSQARSRFVAIMVSATYVMSASRGLPQGIANYYGTNGLLGIVLWIGASSAFVLVYGVLWSSKAGWSKPFRFSVATVLMSVPPFGIVGWASPITGAGVLFPGMGWFGLASALVLLLVLTTSKRRFALTAASMLWAVSSVTWTAPATPRGWIGIDTHFQGVDGQYAGYDQELRSIRLVRAAIARGDDRVLLPESALGIWTPTVERLWIEGLQGTNAVVIGGAVVVNATGYDNVMIEVSASGGRVLYRQRMPVPVSMWQPWLAWFGRSGGARADFFANPSISSHGEPVAVLICYEQLLVWPTLESMLYRPATIIAASNDWWTAGTDIAALQRATITAWARLFNAPVVFAVNS